MQQLNVNATLKERKHLPCQIAANKYHPHDPLWGFINFWSFLPYKFYYNPLLIRKGRTRMQQLNVSATLKERKHLPCQIAANKYHPHDPLWRYTFGVFI